MQTKFGRKRLIFEVMKISRCVIVALLGSALVLAAPKPVDMKLLVLAVDGTEPSYLAIETFLSQVGVPHRTVLTKNEPLPALSDPARGFYQGIILTTGNLALCDESGCRSALPPSDWSTLEAYAADYSVRILSYYTYPEPRYGLTFNEAASAPGYIHFLPDAAEIFPYLKLETSLPVTGAFAYLASTVEGPGESTKPILEIAGRTVGVIHKKPDGREYLALTVDNSPFLLHSMILNYGLIKWVTRGVFLGARRVYLSPQVDDLFLPNQLVDFNIDACTPRGAVVDSTLDLSRPCPRLRIAGADLEALSAWQDSVRARPQMSAFRTDLAFNGFGAINPDDDLVAAARSLRSKFFWTSHTYDHKSLDCFTRDPCTPATYDQSTDEIVRNLQTAATLELPLDVTSVVTPEISGLKNPDFLQAAFDRGVRYLVADSSRQEGTPPSANAGVRNTLQPGILMIPRRATSIFFNAAMARTGMAGSETDEYNYFYGPNGLFRIGGPGGPPFYATDRAYDQIVDIESAKLLTAMLRYEPYPLMFHQSNVWRYDGSRSLFTDTIEATLSKFTAISNLPVVSLSQTAIGNLIDARMTYDASGVEATLVPGERITLRAARTAVIPITGVCAEGCEEYGGEKVSYIRVPAGEAITVSKF